MPVYEYACKQCGQHIEVMQKISDPPLKQCKVCNGELDKLISRTSFQLKGAGWYQTDYKPKAAAEKPESKPSPTDSKTPGNSNGSGGNCGGGGCATD